MNLFIWIAFIVYCIYVSFNKSSSFEWHVMAFCTFSSSCLIVDSDLHVISLWRIVSYLLPFFLSLLKHLQVIFFQCGGGRRENLPSLVISFFKILHWLKNSKTLLKFVYGLFVKIKDSIYFSFWIVSCLLMIHYIWLTN